MKRAKALFYCFMRFSMLKRDRAGMIRALIRIGMENKKIRLFFLVGHLLPFGAL